MCLGVLFLGFILYITLWASWTWVAISFPIFRKIFYYNPFKYFLMPFAFVFFSETPVIQMLGVLNIVPEVSGTLLITFYSLLCSASVILTILYSSSPIHSSVSLTLLLVLSSSVQSLNHGWLFVTPWTTACQASLSITNSQSMLKLMSIKSVMPSSHCCPLLLLSSIFSSIRVFSSESVLCIRWPEYWSFSFSISLSNEYSGLISFRMDFLDLLVLRGTLKSLCQHHSSKASERRPPNTIYWFSTVYF